MNSIESFPNEGFSLLRIKMNRAPGSHIPRKGEQLRFSVSVGESVVVPEAAYLVVDSIADGDELQLILEKVEEDSDGA